MDHATDKSVLGDFNDASFESLMDAVVNGMIQSTRHNARPEP